MDQLMFCVLSTMGAKLCLVLLTRDVKTASYQLLLEEEMVPSIRKHFGLNFLFVHNNVLAHREWKFQKFLENPEIKVLPRLAYLPYLNPIKHWRDIFDHAVNMREFQLINQRDSRMALAKKGLIFQKEAIISWWNPCQDKSALWSKSMDVPHDMDFFFFGFSHVDKGGISWVCLNFFSSCSAVMLFFVNFFYRNLTFSKPTIPMLMINLGSNQWWIV